MEEKEVGRVTDYFSKINVAALEITGESLQVGDTIHIKGHTTDIQQTVDSIQIEKASVSLAKKGDRVGIKVKDRVRPHDMVFKVIQ
jgi:translation elongation factor EF-1alpha